MSAPNQPGSLRFYKGKEIYHLDYTNKKNIKDLVEAIQEAREFRIKAINDTGRKDVLILVDLTDSFVFGEGLDELKRSGKELQPITKRRAVVGLNTTKKILLNSVNLFTKSDYKAFDTLEEAQEWLIK